ncbi:MAG TPA: Crp/Fnr family transcriptional regulator [Rhodanobacteraceae bacterium]|nr:Crp/Fnr family transcriptional regulator [Rhodanobacteraceae bacterium]
MEARPNGLLAALPAREHDRLAPHLESINLRLGETLYEPGQLQKWVYFPAGAVISKLYVMNSGATGAIALAGIEGVVGFSLYMGGSTAPTRAAVQVAGAAHRIKGDVLRREFDGDGILRQLLLRYTEALLVQIGQTAVCNRHHTIDQQLCRWLLMILDRLPSDQMVMTQELIARMLGVRREGVTEAAGHLQRAGVIRYSRGHIKVIDRERMEALSCECYASVRHELARLLPWCDYAGCEHDQPGRAQTNSSGVATRHRRSGASL